MATRKTQPKKSIETLVHDEATRKNIPTAEYQSVMHKEDQAPKKVSYPRGDNELTDEKENRNRDLDPQLVWRGKDQQDWSDLVVNAPPVYIQEKVHPKVLIDDLLNRTEVDEKDNDAQPDLFGDFNGLVDEGAKTEFYQHDAHWTNRMILGDSLQVMASLAEREQLRGKVQCIYFDPPYGIKFNSNFQWSTGDKDVKDGKVEHITREPEQVKAFRDTWRDGIHSYLTYLRDRLMVARDLLSDSGSIFVQISDENIHLVRGLLDEVFGTESFVAQISFRKTSPLSSSHLARINDYVLWFAKKKEGMKFRRLFEVKAYGGGSTYSRLQFPDGTRRAMTSEERGGVSPIPNGARVFAPDNTRSSGYTDSCFYSVKVWGFNYAPQKYSWKTHRDGMERLKKAHRLAPSPSLPYYVRFYEDFPIREVESHWSDTRGDMDKTYVVQTSSKVIERCILMATDPGDLVLDPTCGSGTTAYVAEQWGRRWITVDTSRVSLALARARIMGARYPFYLLADSHEGQLRDAAITRSAPSSKPVHGNIHHGFVYERAPHVTLKSIANNTEIDVIWDKFQGLLEPIREQLNKVLDEKWEEWEIPRESSSAWSDTAKSFHAKWWEQRIARQKEIDASIAARADLEYLYDKPYQDNKKVRVAGPFTVESLSPHRMLGVDEHGDLIDPKNTFHDGGDHADVRDFTQMVLENLKTAGVQQSHKEDKIAFTSLAPWPGYLICGEGSYFEGGEQAGIEKRAAVFIGPEFGTVSRPDLVAAAREAGDADFDVLIACAFNYDAHSTEFDKLGRVPVLKARMNADLHMADDLKNTGKGNLFVVFGEPDIEIIDLEENKAQIKVNGVDVFHPNTGEIRSDGADGIACWFIDTDYNAESFFVRHAYFLGANDPYKSLKTTLKAEINEEAWSTLNSDTSRPFTKPASGRIAVKVINHLGDEVMKVFKVE